MKFTINRTRWYRGNGGCGSALLLRGGKMCCLGFYLKSCGIQKKKLLGKETPDDVVSCIPKQAKWLFGKNKNDTQELMTLNDVINKSRRREIAKIFAKHNVKVIFKD